MSFMLIRVIPRVIAFLLIAESMFSALNISTLVGQITIYEPLTIALIVVRGFVATLQFVGGWTLAQRKPQGRPLAQFGLIAGALLTPFDVGLGLAPSPVYPWWRWQATAIYVGYALSATMVVRHGNRSI